MAKGAIQGRKAVSNAEQYIVKRLANAIRELGAFEHEGVHFSRHGRHYRCSQLGPPLRTAKTLREIQKAYDYEADAAAKGVFDAVPLEVIINGDSWRNVEHHH